MLYFTQFFEYSPGELDASKSISTPQNLSTMKTTLFALITIFMVAGIGKTQAQGKPALIKKAEVTAPAPTVATAPASEQIAQAQVSPPPATPVTPIASEPTPKGKIEGPKKAVTIDPINNTVTYKKCDSLWVATNVPLEYKREQGPR